LTPFLILIFYSIFMKKRLLDPGGRISSFEEKKMSTRYMVGTRRQVKVLSRCKIYSKVENSHEIGAIM